MTYAGANGMGGIVKERECDMNTLLDEIANELQDIDERLGECLSYKYAEHIIWIVRKYYPEVEFNASCGT